MKRFDTSCDGEMIRKLIADVMEASRKEKEEDECEADCEVR